MHQEESNLIVWLLHDTARLWRRRYQRQLRAEIPGITPARCAVLILLARGDALNEAGLARVLDIDPMTVVRLVDGLEAAGVLKRMPDPGGRRAHVLQVTDKALPMVERIAKLASGVDDTAQLGIPKAEVFQMLTVLRRVRSNLAAPAQ